MSIAMWEAIAENKRRSAILIVSMALILGGLAGVIGYGVGGTEESAALGALAGLAVWRLLRRPKGDFCALCSCTACSRREHAKCGTCRGK